MLILLPVMVGCKKGVSGPTSTNVPTTIPIAPASSSPASYGVTYTVSPGQSIQSSIEKMVSGDSLIINSGVYNESLNISTSGLTILGRGAPVIDAQFNSVSVIRVAADHITLRGLVLQNSKGPGVLFEGSDSHDNVIDHSTIQGWDCSAKGVEYVNNIYPYSYSGAVNINMGAYNITVSNCLIDRGNVEAGKIMNTNAISWSWDDSSNPPKTGGGNKFIDNIIWGISRDSDGKPITKQSDFGDGYPLYKFNIWDGISGRDGMNLVNWDNSLVQGNHIYGAFDDCIEPEADDINLIIYGNYIDSKGGADCIVLRGASVGPIHITDNIMVNAGICGFKYGGWSLGPGIASKYIINNTYFSTLARKYAPYPNFVFDPSASNSFIDGEANDNNYDNLLVDSNYVHTGRYFVALMSGSGHNNTFSDNHFSTNDRSSCVKWFGDVISLNTFNSKPGCSSNIWQLIPIPQEPSVPDAGGGN